MTSDSEQYRQEEIQDKRVDNGQLVNLKRSGVASQTVLPGQVGFLVPLHRVRELNWLWNC